MIKMYEELRAQLAEDRAEIEREKQRANDAERRLAAETKRADTNSSERDEAIRQRDEMKQLADEEKDSADMFCRANIKLEDDTKLIRAQWLVYKSERDEAIRQREELEEALDPLHELVWLPSERAQGASGTAIAARKKIVELAAKLATQEGGWKHYTDTMEDEIASLKTQLAASEASRQQTERDFVATRDGNIDLSSRLFKAESALAEARGQTRSLREALGLLAAECRGYTMVAGAAESVALRHATSLLGCHPENQPLGLSRTAPEPEAKQNSEPTCFCGCACKGTCTDCKKPTGPQAYTIVSCLGPGCPICISPSPQSEPQAELLLKSERQAAPKACGCHEPCAVCLTNCFDDDWCRCDGGGSAVRCPRCPACGTGRAKESRPPLSAERADTNTGSSDNRDSKEGER